MFFIDLYNMDIIVLLFMFELSYRCSTFVVFMDIVISSTRKFF